MPNRTCPNCSQPAIAVSRLLMSDAECPNCRALVGPHWLFGTVFYIIIFAVTLGTTIAVLSQFGIYAAVLWFSFPIGAIGYLKARFSPLVTKHANLGPPSGDS